MKNDSDNNVNNELVSDEIESLPETSEETSISEEAAISSEELPDVSQKQEDSDEEPSILHPPVNEAEDDSVGDDGKRIIKPYSERAYLLYGNAPSAERLDTNGTKAFLNDLGFDGGELRQARLGKSFSEKMDASNQNGESDHMFCSYCGAEIKRIDFVRLPDGRLRCNTCTRTTVRSKEELNEIYHRVLCHLEALFGATILVPVSVEMLEERQLKKKTKHPLSAVDDKNILVLGVAVNQKKEYSVYLENGSPRLSVVATFAHELTHIWQYTHWDAVKGFPKLSTKAKLLVYEGMAKWVEIQYLYLIGEFAAAKREEEFTLTRNDEYGIGFRLYADRYPLSKDTMSCSENPFQTNAYPIS